MDMIFSHFYRTIVHTKKSAGICVIASVARQSRKYICLLFMLIAYSPTLYARWATIMDADVKYEMINQSIILESDGSYIEHTEIQAKVLKESGKDKLVSAALPYNASNTVFKILEAKTIVAGTEYPVDPKNIEDKPLASNIQGFDQNNQVLIAFPKMQLNASIYLKFSAAVSDPPIKGFFDKHLDFGLNGYCEQRHFQIKSAIPLYINIHDPEKVFDSKEFEKDHNFYFETFLKKPVFFSAIDEAEPLVNTIELPWIRIATLKEWSDFGTKIADPFEKVLQEPLPSYFKPLLESARQHNNTIDQINAITSALAELLTYMGDWRTVKGAYAPRSLAKIAETRFGDCKDFSATTVALLRQLGLKASVALVSRGFPSYDNTFVLPGFNNFNHAIAYVQTVSGPLWIDPTNFSSFAPFIYPDIANRQSLILFKNNPTIAGIPDITAHSSKRSIVENIALKQEGTIQSKGHLSLSGWQALDLTGSDLKASKASIDLNVLGYITNQNRLLDWKVQDYDLRSRIAKPLDFSFEYAAQNATIKSSAGKAYLISENNIVPRILVKTKDRVSDLYLGLPSIMHHELTLDHTQSIGHQFLNCDIKSPWFEGQRRIEDTPIGIKISDTQTLLQSIVRHKDLQSKAYQDLQSQTYACFGDLALIYQTIDTP